jgi:hypothetical protein
MGSLRSLKSESRREDKEPVSVVTYCTHSSIINEKISKKNWFNEIKYKVYVYNQRAEQYGIIKKFDEKRY